MACAALLSGTCARAEAPAAVAVASATVAQSTEAVPSAGKPAAQRGLSLSDVYWVPDGARDPFAEVPVRPEGSGPSASPRLGGKAKNVKFSMDSLVLVGLFSAAQGPQAVLADRENGVSYTLSRGFIYDRKHKPVQNYSGVLEGREVTIFGPGNASRKLKLPEKGKPGKQQ